MKRGVFLNRLIYGLPHLMIGGQLLLHSSCRKDLMVRENDDHNTSSNNSTVDEFKTPLNIPKVINGGNLNAQYTSANLSSEFSTRGLGYDQGGILGPTLSLEKGEMLNIQFTNQMVTIQPRRFTKVWQG